MCKWIPQVQIKSKQFATTCPSIDQYNYHCFSGGGRLILAAALLENRLQFTPDVLDIIYKCTECGACSISCKYLNALEPLDVIQALREAAVEQGAGPMPIQRKFIANTIEHHNPYGEEPQKRLNWLPKDIHPNPNAPLAYFVGCTSSYRRKEIAIATARILQAAHIEFRLLGEDEWCCGSPVLRVGHHTEFAKIAKRNIDTLEAQGVKEVVMSCSGCFSTFSIEYPLIQKPHFKITHSVDFFNRLLKTKKIHPTIPVPLTVTYHDPCHLGRGSEAQKKWFGIEVEVLALVRLAFPPKPLRRGTYGIYDSPREVLNQIPGLKLVEMERIREYSYCCGAGGGVKSAFPDFALNTSKNRIQEAKATGASCISSACPFCSTNLQDGIAALGESLQFYDIAELLCKSLGLDGGAQ